MFNAIFTTKSGKEFIGRVVEQGEAFQAQIFNLDNEEVFTSTAGNPSETEKNMRFHFSTIKNDL